MPLVKIEEHFSDQRIVHLLCRKRLDLARKRRRENFISGLVGSQRSPIERSNAAWSQLLGKIMPPRRLWNAIRPDKAHRSSGDPSAFLGNLERFVLEELARPSHSPWTLELRAVIDEIRGRAMAWQPGQEFKYAHATAVAKDRPGNDRDYRPLAIYAPIDSLICAGFASYLRECIDDVLAHNCYAFRAARGDRPPTHHDAVVALQKYRASIVATKSIWVSECDIEGFFDAAAHDVVRSAVNRLVQKTGVPLCPPFQDFLCSFLSGYDYPSLLRDAKASILRQGISSPKFKDMEAILLKNKYPVQEFGIPQGSQLSCVLANVLLASADEDCNNAMAGFEEPGMYLRYCDDVILAHIRRARCRQMLDAYLERLTQLRLPFHIPQDVAVYSKTYWSMKSKLPFEWRLGTRGRSSPWVSFVGYQIRRDGVIRVRAKSVHKELHKQAKVASDTISAFRRTQRQAKKSGKTHSVPSTKSQRTRLLYHLMSISVGIPKLYSLRAPESKVCWAAGFPLVVDYASDAHFARRLDRGRRVVLQKVLHELRRSVKARNIKPTKGDIDEWKVRYDGFEFSYFRALFGPRRPPVSG